MILLFLLLLLYNFWMKFGGIEIIEYGGGDKEGEISYGLVRDVIIFGLSFFFESYVLGFRFNDNLFDFEYEFGNGFMLFNFGDGIISSVLVYNNNDG